MEDYEDMAGMPRKCPRPFPVDKKLLLSFSGDFLYTFGLSTLGLLGLILSYKFVMP